ncbi:hypothetical protein MESS2_680008 [Mesorhizobium metallidurans STM 2683]|uniref:Uncharacterized protein n=1 Tax=Mesorhizobium metallidurans STM 2683 TaxID=1297569 RepID=M5EVN2_9HYPH|nr:hypothetical protein MESS2_680008 [Mesorhizobium metallidurans STM 2683]
MAERPTSEFGLLSLSNWSKLGFPKWFKVSRPSLSRHHQLMREHRNSPRRGVSDPLSMILLTTLSTHHGE